MRSPGVSMSRGLPTFRAGGCTSYGDSPCIEDSLKRKTALKTHFFSNDHFSSSLAKNEDPKLKRTKVTVKLLEGKNLLVSDLPTGTSDPIASVWVGPSDEGNVNLQTDQRIQSTEVRQHTVDPVWDADFVFPLEVKSLEDIMSGKVNILVRDFDDADGDVHYLDLGRVAVLLERVIIEGNIMAHAQLVQLPAHWYTLERCRAMRRVTGALKIAIGIFVGNECDLSLDENCEAESPVDQAVLFERTLRRIRMARGASIMRNVSASPIHRTRGRTRGLTARGGTMAERPKSAPTAATLSSPNRVRRRSFELRPLQAKFPSQASRVDHESNNPQTYGRVEVRQVGDKSLSRDISEDETKERPTRQGTFQSPERALGAPSQSTHGTSMNKTAMLAPEQETPPGVEPHHDLFPTKWEVEDPPKPAVRTSSELSRLVAKALNAHHRIPQHVAKDATEKQRTKVSANRWHTALLESMQRLEERSTEGVAYGELRAMAREASVSQVAQILAAVRGVGKSCSVSARRYTLRLLSWLCWDQPRATSKIYGGIVAYALDRIKDDETASLRGDLVVCVGAMMLSAMRNSTAEECMVQTLRFLNFTKEQSATVRESAGACVAAAVHPARPPVPVELETDLRSIDDVRVILGQIAGRFGTTCAVPKGSVLLPNGRAVIELPDALRAAEVYRHISMMADEFPSAWCLYPFPEELCNEVRRAETAHAARLTVNSEEILASILEVLESSRSEGTRALLLDGITAMTSVCIMQEGELTAADPPVNPNRGSNISKTLAKGLPAITHGIWKILTCPVRRTYSWRERVAALDVICGLARLRSLHGTRGPLGEHRVKLIQAATQSKRDCIDGVRKAAGRALDALGASKAEYIQLQRCGKASPDTVSLGGRAAGNILSETKAGYLETQQGVGKGRKKKNALEVLMKKKEKLSGKHGQRGERKQTGPSPERGETSVVSHRGVKDSHDQQPDGAPSLMVALLSAADTPKSSNEPTEAEKHNANDSTSRRFSSTRVLKGSSRAPEEIDVDHENKWMDSKGAPCSPDGRHAVSTAEGGNALEDAGLHRDSHYIPIEDIKSKTTVDSTSFPVDMVGVTLASAQVALGSQSPSPCQAADVAQSPSASRPHMQDDAPVATVSAACNVSPAIDGDVRVGTISLLRNISQKSDNISNVLTALSQRLLGMEKSLEERLHGRDSPSRTFTRKFKRLRSSRVQQKTVPVSLRGSRYRYSTCDPTRQKNIRRKTERLVAQGDIDGAFRLVLASGNERDVVRLMGNTGGPRAYRRRMGMETRDHLFAFFARLISSGQYAEYVLPWVFELVQAGEARSLPIGVRMQLAGALHGLAAAPTSQGVMAARLGPHLSLATLGRSSPSSNVECGELFRIVIEARA